MQSSLCIEVCGPRGRSVVAVSANELVGRWTEKWYTELARTNAADTRTWALVAEDGNWLRPYGRFGDYLRASANLTVRVNIVEATEAHGEGEGTHHPKRGLRATWSRGSGLAGPAVPGPAPLQGDLFEPGTPRVAEPAEPTYEAEEAYEADEEPNPALIGVGTGGTSSDQVNPRELSPAWGIGTSPGERDRAPREHFGEGGFERAMTRTLRYLPARLSRRERREEARAAARSAEARTVGEDFALRRPVSRRQRVRECYASTEYEARLGQAIGVGRSARCGVVAVVSPKGGVGKTTTSGLVGSLLSQHRAAQVLCIDANPDYGTLGSALAPEAEFYVDDLARLLRAGDQESYVEAMGRISRAGSAGAGGLGGLLVLPGPPSGERMQVVDDGIYIEVLEHMRRVMNFIVLDCGTGMFDPITVAALAAADQIVLLSDAEPNTAGVVAQAVEDTLSLTKKPITLVVNKWSEGHKRLNLQALMGSVEPQADVTVVLLDDKPSAASELLAGQFTWQAAPSGWRVSAREIAAVLVGRWREMGVISLASGRRVGAGVSGVVDY